MGKDGKKKRDMVAVLLDMEDDVRAALPDEPDHIKAAYNNFLSAIGGLKSSLTTLEAQERPPPRDR